MAPQDGGWEEWGRYVLEEIKRINVCLVAIQGDLLALRREREDRIGGLEKDLEERLRDVEKEVAKLGERLKIMAVAQSIFTSIAATLAGWFGAK